MVEIGQETSVQRFVYLLDSTSPVLRGCRCRHTMCVRGGGGAQ